MECMKKKVNVIKVTVRGLLINTFDEHIEEVDELITVFSSAKRFAFKRLLENKMKKGEIEKLISSKYNLNIRQSKDIGIDTNPDGLALTRLDKDGNYKWSVYLKEPELLYARTNRRENLCGELVKKVIDIAEAEQCAISFEDLKFRNDRDVKSKFSRIKHQFIYSKLLSMLEVKAIRENVQYFKVKPQFTSKIGLYKYCHQYGLDVHNGAALVIGRRAFGFNEKIPKILKDKLLQEKEIEKFGTQTNWKQWSIINKKIKKKGGEYPGLWLKNRKVFLNIA